MSAVEEDIYEDRQITPFTKARVIVHHKGSYVTLEKAKELGVDEVRIKSAQLYDYQFGNPLMPDNEHYSRYKKNRKGTYELKHPGGNHCWRMWSGSVVTWDGKVVPCCFDKDASHKLGQVKNNTFKEVWKGPSYQSFRKSIIKSRSEIDICTN